MEPWLAGVIILGAATLTAACMLVVQRRAAESFFRDPVPVAAVYTVVGTAYMVIVAFVFFVAFESYHTARVDAEAEATATLAMYFIAVPFDPTERAELQEHVVCYAREVIADDWPAMRDGEHSTAVDARVRAMEATAARVTLEGDNQVAAYEHWFALNEERRAGRRGRVAQASGLVPPVLWLILIVGAAVVIAGVGLFADRREPRLTQALMMVSIVVIVASGLLMVRFFDRPYEQKSGSIEPTAMASSLEQMEAQDRQLLARIRC